MKADPAIENLTRKHPDLRPVIPAITELGQRLNTVFDCGGRLFVAGNGGSAADAQHIVGELMKSYQRERQLSEEEQALFNGLPEGNMLAENLETGLPALVLGLNHSLTSAIANDFTERHLEFAQELWILGEERDAFLGISTSGRARNILYAMITAKTKGMYVAALTGSRPSPISDIADLAIRAPSRETAEIQQMHEVIYHCLCGMLEEHFLARH